MAKFFWDDNFKMDHTSARGRALMIRYKCDRCGAEQIETVSEAIEHIDGNYFGEIERLRPGSWADRMGWLLCEDCDKELIAFLRNRRTETEILERG